MRRLYAACLLLVVWLQPTLAEACAGCRNPSMPVARGNEGPLPAHELRLGAALSSTRVRVVHEAGCRDLLGCTEVPAQRLYLHDQTMYPVELRLSAEYAIDETWAVEAQFPFRAVFATVDYRTPDGAPYTPLDEGVHHRDETVAGPADPWLLGRVASSFDEWWLGLRLGVSLPLGSTEDDPFELGDQGLRHQHIQLGSGTVDPIAQLELSKRFDSLNFQAFALGQGAVYSNPHGYRAPLRLYAGTSLGSKLIGALSGSLGPEVLHESAERWNDEIRQDGNLGRTELLAAVSLDLNLGETKLGLGVRVPLWRQIVVGDEPPGELESPLSVTLSVTQHLHLGEHPPHTD